MTTQQFYRVLNKVCNHVNDYFKGLKGEEKYKIREWFWTPCDMIIKECLMRREKHSKIYLGITQQECLDAFNYICEHKEELIEKDMISEDGFVLENKMYENGKSRIVHVALWKHYDFQNRF